MHAHSFNPLCTVFAREVSPTVYIATIIKYI